MSAYRICIYVLLLLEVTVGAIAHTTPAPLSTKASTCPSRTINYLTHTLPQQCLPAVRSATINATIVDNNTITRGELPISSRNSEHSSKLSDVLPPSHTSETQSVDETSDVHPSSNSSSPTSIQSVATVTATPITDSISVALIPSVVEEASPLESDNFLSFEEWKKQNLIKAGQSEHVGRSGRSEPIEQRKRPRNVHNTLDSLGDDAEIDIDFSVFVPSGPDAAIEHVNQENNSDLGNQGTTNSGSRLGAGARSKDAGTTCKERFNYASLDCAASILKTNPEAKSPNTVLMENKDLYMLNKCSAKSKFIILELCEDISIDTIVVANFEFFSSSFRTFRVSVSDKYPVKTDKWQSLGTFEGRNTREVQAFLVENPVIWARYVRIEFLTHYGNEFYCPVSLIRVHGTTMMEEYKHDLDMNREDDDDDMEQEVGEDEAVISDPVVGLNELDNGLESDIQKVPDEMVKHHISQISTLTDGATDEGQVSSSENPDTKITTSPNEIAVAYDAFVETPTDTCHPNHDTSQSFEHIETPPNEVTSTAYRTTSTSNISESEKSRSVSLPVETRHTQTSSTTPPAQSTGKVQQSQRDNSTEPNTRNSSDSKKSGTPNLEQARMNSTSKESSRSVSGKQSTSVASHAAAPTMQESFFKSVQKRLQMLESNSSLSLQYIEEQSRALRDAFRKVEQRQLSKTSLFLEHLNQTVLNELREFRQQYDQLWQSTVIELEIQSERYQQESQAMHARLGILADELIFQRRVSMLQMFLVLVCLGLVLFSRGGANAYLELPRVQSVLSRSPTSKWANESIDSRGSSPALTRIRSGHRPDNKTGILKGHRRAVSEESNVEAFSASEPYSPPTPVSYDGFSDAEVVKPESKLDDPDFDPSQIERPSTSPPVLPSIEDPSTPRSISSYLDDTSIDSRLQSPNPGVDGPGVPNVRIEQPTPPGRHLTWDLPDQI